MRTVTATGAVTWFNAFMNMNVEYSITNRNDICGNGLKAMLGQAVTRTVPTVMFILVLCPVILNQTDGQPKMFADLYGEDLQTNNRPDVDWGSASDPTPMTPANTINMMTWVGQHIDQLRDRVLSVIMGRILLLVSVNQLFDLTGIEGKIQTSLYHFNLSLFKKLISDTVTTNPQARTFDDAKRLPLQQAISNADSLSLYMTGQ